MSLWPKYLFFRKSSKYGRKFLSNFNNSEYKKFIKSFIKIEAVFKLEKEKQLFYKKKYNNFIDIQYRLYNLKDSRKFK